MKQSRKNYKNGTEPSKYVVSVTTHININLGLVVTVKMLTVQGFVLVQIH